MTQTLEAGEFGRRADEYVLRLDQYNHYTFPITLTSGSNDTPINAVGGSLVWTIRRKPGDPTLKSFTITWPNQAGGVASAYIYSDLPCGPRETDLASQYFHEMVYIDSLGNVLTSIKGPCIINRGAPRT